MSLPLPLTVNVATNGAVSIEHADGVVAMSRFGDRARRFTLDFGPGVHRIATATDVADLPAHTLADLVDALA
jgi:hypothetical protein